MIATVHRLVYAILYLLAAATSLLAHDVITTNLTFTRDIARIFARHCAACHSNASDIPLVTYEQARPWAVSIKEQVLSRAMPPFGAVKGFGNLSPDRALSQEDILIIAAWVVGGAPKGDDKLLPASRLSSINAPNHRLNDALVIDTQTRLERTLTVCGLKPITSQSVTSARITAQLPTGKVVPLVWLYRFDPKLDAAFTFREPIELPRGTLIISSAPLRFALQTPAPQSSATGTVKTVVFTVPSR